METKKGDNDALDLRDKMSSNNHIQVWLNFTPGGRFFFSGDGDSAIFSLWTPKPCSGCFFRVYLCQQPSLGRCSSAFEGLMLHSWGKSRFFFLFLTNEETKLTWSQDLTISVWEQKPGLGAKKRTVLVKKKNGLLWWEQSEYFSNPFFLVVLTDK